MRTQTLEAKSLEVAARASGREARAVIEPLPVRAGPAAAAGQTLEVLPPLSGLVVPLDAVPDPVFARRLVGDGVAIDPTSNEVLAPFAGTVTQLHDAHHAVAITNADGIEVLIHVGLDTVALRGRGFTALVARGAQVEAGQALLRFDPELVAREARSLISAVVVTERGRVRALHPVHGLVGAGVGVLFTLELAGAQVPARAVQGGETVLSEVVVLPNPEGLHARPAAVLAAEARRYSSEVKLLGPQGEANARSLVAVMGLSTKKGDAVRVRATGSDARAAVAALTRLLQEGCGEKAGAKGGEPTLTLVPPPAPEQARVVAGAGELAGAAASPGLAIGRVLQHRAGALVVPERGGSELEERTRYAAALREASAQLEKLKAQAAPLQAQLLGMHQELLQDPELAELAEGPLRAGKSAAFAWQQAYTTHAGKLEKLENKLLRERASDVRDVGRRALALLAGAQEQSLTVSPGTILIAEEVSPSEMASLERSKLAGLCTTTGSATSHVAILARAMGLPAVCGIDEAALALEDGAQVILDGTRGLLRTNPTAAQLEQVTQQLARDASRRTAEQGAAAKQAHTKDGHRVEVVANITSVEDAKKAVAAGAEGVGLLRTELLFEDRDTAPSEDEQAAQYGAIAAVLGKERPFVIRTLDAGADKPLSYLQLPKEQNPFLGLRGVRISLAYPEMFRTQLRAVLRSAAQGDVHVMFPMISDLGEVRAARQLLAEEQARLGGQVKVGVMIEVPSAALQAELLAREVDFFSIGTNDLTQYVLAMDRGHPKLARQAEAIHPAVLKMIGMTCDGARVHGKWVGVCGGLASDPQAAPLLVGLGVKELSVSVPAIASVKAALARFTLAECQSLAQAALRLGTISEVRALLVAHAEAHASVEG